MILPAHIVVRQAGYADVDPLVEFSAAMARETEGRSLDRDRLRHGTLAVLDAPSGDFSSSPRSLTETALDSQVN